MASPSDFLEFKTVEGNASYVRKTSIAAIHHDGVGTRIRLVNVPADLEQGLISSEMPDVLISRLKG